GWAKLREVEKPGLGFGGGKPVAPARLSRRECGCDDVGALMHKVEEGVSAPRHDMAEVAVGGELLHVGVHVDHECFRTLAHGPVHGVALVEAGAAHQAAVEL